MVAAYLGVVAFKEWATGYFSAYICWMYGVFKLDRING